MNVFVCVMSVYACVSVSGGYGYGVVCERDVLYVCSSILHLYSLTTVCLYILCKVARTGTQRPSSADVVQLV